MDSPDPRIPLVHVGHIGDMQQDPQNPNDGTERGTYTLSTSVQRLGPGRSGLADANLTLVAGNKSQEALGAAGFEEVVYVHPKEGQWVVVVRDDWDLGASTDSEAYQQPREMSFVDNQAALTGIKFSAPNTQLAISQGVELDPYFREFELDNILKGDIDPIRDDGDDEGDGDSSGIHCKCPECGHEFIKLRGNRR